jgi:hypothetical protein
LPEHPFLGGDHGQLANVVFSDYLFAWQLTRPGSSMGVELRRWLASEPYLPSPLLARFMLTWVDSSQGQLVGGDVGFVYESMISAGRTFSLTMSGATPDSALGLFEFGDQLAPSEQVEFSVDTSGGGIAFWRRLLAANVDVRTDVSLGRPGGHFILGPDVDLSCRVLQVELDELEVVADGKDVVLVADAFASNPSVRLRVYDGDRFKVWWEPLEYPWVTHRLDRQDGTQEDNQAVLDAFAVFCRVLKWFRSSWTGDMQRSKKLLRNPAITGASGIPMLEFLLSQGVISDTGSHYKLDTSKLAAWGINWNDLKGRKLQPRLAEILSGFVGSL